ncbi:cytochrome P450 [Daldinia bambusicola]|nr:cytochrome P450 [Daldinia bambusicola]
MELIQLRPVIAEILQARTILLIFLVIVGHWTYKSIYNLYFHPLHNVPGPRAAAISNIPYCWWFLGGRLPYKMLELHNKYGISAQSWRDIYGARPGHKTFVKSKFYDGGSFAGIGTSSIISERRPEVHKQMRNYLAGAFSDRAILEQENIVATSVDEFIRLVGVRGSRKGGFNISTTLQSLTFDITGDLSFGKTFGALKSEKPHPWISVSLEAMTQGEIVDVLNRFPLLAKILPVLMSSKLKKLTENTKKNEELSYKAVQSRVARKTSRKDFLTRILEDRDPLEVPDRAIAAHASDFVIAGSDTAATALSAALYYLLRDSRASATKPVPTTATAMSRLTSEIRTAFEKYADINYSSTASLPYLRAVLLEAMRVYPPVPMATPREVPEGGDVVDGVFLPGGVTVSTNPLAASLSPSNFHDPWSFKPERWLQRPATATTTTTTTTISNSDSNGKSEPQPQPQPESELGSGLEWNDDLDSSQPFSLGARGCLGRNLAWLDMRSILAKLVWTYDLELVGVSSSASIPPSKSESKSKGERGDSLLDWHAESRMHTLWRKPALMVRARNRGVDITSP